MSTTLRNATVRRASGLTGMLVAAGVLVALKNGGVAPHPVTALPVTPTVTGTVTRVAGLLGSRVTASPTGAVTDTPFGPVQVQLVIRAGRIVDVHALQLPSSADYSRQVAAYSEPLLRQEVLTAQSARIDVVSGATYTSEGYAQSVQAALDQLHVGA